MRSVASRIRRRARRSPALRRVVRALRDHRRRTRSSAAEVDAAERQLAAAFHGVEETRSRAAKAVLIPGLTEPSHILLQSPVIAAFRVAGYEPVILLFDASSGPRRLYRAMGIGRFTDFGRYDGRGDLRFGGREMARVRSQEDFLAIRWGGISVGRYAASSMFRAQRLGRLSLDGSDHAAAAGFLELVLDHAAAARRIVADLAPDAALFLDKGYTPQGPLFDACLASGVTPFTWNMAHRDNALMLRRYDAENPLAHPMSLSSETWEEVLRMPWGPAEESAVVGELESAYGSGQWFSEVGTQFRSQHIAEKDLRTRLDLAPDRACVAIFPHIFWDATFFWGEDVFADYEEWFRSTLEAAYTNTAVDWIVKVHPANIVKDAREGVDSEPLEIRTLRDIGEIPPHVRVIQADTDISTLSLLSIADYCLTVRGTVGIEAALLGCRVITAGTGRYDGLGFTIDPKDRIEYLRLLDQLPDVPPMTPSEVEYARRYAYGLLLRRPLTLSAIDARFEHDETATLDVTVRTSPWAELARSPDVSSTARWIATERTDYLTPDHCDAI